MGDKSPKNKEKKKKSQKKAGAKTPQEQTVEALEHVIREAGREPVQRDSFYRHLAKKRAASVAVPAKKSELVCA